MSVENLITLDDARRTWLMADSNHPKTARAQNKQQIRFAESLEAAMDKKSISSEELDQKMEMGPGTTVHYLTGEPRPTRDLIEKYAKILETQPEKLWPGYQVI